MIDHRFRPLFIACALILSGVALVILGQSIPMRTAQAKSPTPLPCHACHSQQFQNLTLPSDPCDACHNPSSPTIQIQNLNRRILTFVIQHPLPHDSRYRALLNAFGELSDHPSWQTIALAESLLALLEADTPASTWVSAPHPFTATFEAILPQRDSFLNGIINRPPLLSAIQPYRMPLLHLIVIVIPLYILYVASRRAPPEAPIMASLISLWKDRDGIRSGLRSLFFCIDLERNLLCHAE
jgi:hypothetical protein